MEQHADGVWSVASTCRLPGGVVLPTRMGVVRLASGALWLHSAIALDDALAAELAALGPVRHVVAPSRMHDLHGGAAKARFGARLHGPPSLRADRPELGIDEVLGAGAPWGDEIVEVPIEGAPALEESAFVHRPSGTLFVTDLLFHVLEPPTLPTRALLWVVGCDGRLAASRSWGWIFAKDRQAVAASAARLLALDWDRLVPAHGPVIERGAHAQVEVGLARILAWRR